MRTIRCIHIDEDNERDYYVIQENDVAISPIFSILKHPYGKMIKSVTLTNDNELIAIDEDDKVQVRFKLNN